MLFRLTLVMVGVLEMTSAWTVGTSEMAIVNVDDGETETQVAEQLDGVDLSPTDDDIHDPECYNGKQIAFSTYLGSDRHGLGKRQHIKFDEVSLNDGKGYDSNTGIFRVPYSGVYSFTVAVGRRGSEIKVRLVESGKTLMSVVAGGSYRSHDDQGSNTVVVHLCKGIPVWVETMSGSNIRGGSIYRPTTFSGFLLYERR